MPVAQYTKPATKLAKTSPGRDQHTSSAKGVQHKDYTNARFYNALYGRNEKPVDLFKQMFRLEVRAGGKSLDITSLVEQLMWQDVSSTGGSSGGDAMVYMNSQPILTGTLQLRKPALSQYKKLVPPLLDGSLSRQDHGVSRFGALGVGVVCSVGYGRTFTPIWAMRVTPTSSGTAAEEVDLSTGQWSLQLADDLAILGQSIDDFKFSRGKRTRRRGWRAHEIAAAVAKQYQVPVARLARGTAWIDFPISDTSAITPQDMIALAYQEENYRTGKAYVMRWAAPTKKWPLGALEVVPMRRNPNLLAFREQLIEAVLTRSQGPGFATVVTGRATLKQANGKHKQITHTAHDARAVRRFGFIHQFVDFKPVLSHLELAILTKRWLGFRLTPLRTADITNPGIATVRRGDAIRIDIPEEGYAETPLTAYGTPKPPRGQASKYTALQLKRAELLDPYLFGLPDETALTGQIDQSQLNIDANQVTTIDSPVSVPVADQSIAFVTGSTHSVTAGSYTLEMTASFVDILDPQQLRIEMDTNIRAGKSLARAQGTG